MLIVFNPNIENILQIYPKERPCVAKVLEILESTAALISNDPKIEVDWKSFHSLIKISTKFRVDERTQCSRDVFNEITQLSLSVESGKIVTGGTKLHDQKDTNLCSFFATMSALRHQLKKVVGNEKSGMRTYYLSGNYAGLQIEEFMNRKDQDEKRFERDLAVMIGCVCPRALSVRFRILAK